MLYRTYKSSVEDSGGIVHGALPKPNTKLNTKPRKALHETP